MFVEKLLEQIGASDEMKNDYDKYKKILGNSLDSCINRYMNNELECDELIEELKAFESDEIHEYTVHLMFILGCTPILKKHYEEANIPEEVFVQTMKDIRAKAQKCYNMKNVFGTFVLQWHDLFLKMKVLGLGRLQYEVMIHSGEDIKLKNYTIKDGDFMLNCHIPALGPLKHSDCVESYKAAYEFFKDRCRDGIMPIRCSSWLLFPPYGKVLETSENITAFVKDFEIYGRSKQDKFEDAWRIFGTDYKDDISVLPQNTSLQKAFVQYLSENNDYGEGKGILLFDGEKIIS